MTRKVGIMQPYLFPYLGYFQLMNAVDEYVIYDDVQFIKRGWINRNRIRLGGEECRFTISVSGASQNKLINEITIHDDFVKFRKTLKMGYSNAPYRDAVLELVESLCSDTDRNLARFAANSLKVVAAYLGISTPMVMSSSLDKEGGLTGQDRIIDICTRMAADVYINAIGGQSLYDRQMFRDRAIDLQFLKPVWPESGADGPVRPDLSILDLMMYNDAQEIRDLLDCYELV